MRECVWALYFSPREEQRRRPLSGRELGKEVKEADLADPDFKGAAFKEGELVVAAAPAFGGRIPGLMAERLKQVKGNGAMAVTVAVYGNRLLRIRWWN